MAKIIKPDTMYNPVKQKRRGVHAKTKFSKVKNSKHYKKLYRGQGK